MTPALLVLHAWGDPLASSRWSPLDDVWPGTVVRFDLPGHGAAAPPTGGSYTTADAALYGDRALRDAGLADAPVVVFGDASAGFAAELLAAAGRTTALVLVDGLGAPWATPAEVMADNTRWCNEVLSDPAALAPHDGGGDGAVDPRVTHGFPTVWERAFTEARRRSIAVPVLALETPASPTPRAEVPDRLAAFAGPAVRIDIDDRTATAVAPALSRVMP